MIAAVACCGFVEMFSRLVFTPPTNINILSSLFRGSCSPTLLACLCSSALSRLCDFWLVSLARRSFARVGFLSSQESLARLVLAAAEDQVVACSR